MACGGAPTFGPLVSSLTAAVSSGRPLAIKAKRRGVAKVSSALAAKPAFASSAMNNRAKSSLAFTCIRAGISSENSSRRKSVIKILPARGEGDRPRDGGGESPPPL